MSSAFPACAAIATAFSGNAALMRSASASRSACFRLARTTWAPCSASARAMALPLPRLAPVTRATRPSILKRSPCARPASTREVSGTADRIGRPMATISGKAAEGILERVFQPPTKPTARDQAEETLRHPKRLVYVAMSNKVFYWRTHIQKFVLDSGMVPVSPFMLFDYYLMHTVSKEIVREAMNNLLARCDEVWVCGHMSLGVKVQVGIAKRMSKPVRYFDISDLPVAVLPMSEETAREETS